jgi:hypothetical protein
LFPTFAGGQPSHKSISANQETVLRHLEPALAIELELHRLKSYDITVRGPATPFLGLFILFVFPSYSGHTEFQ